MSYISWKPEFAQKLKLLRHQRGLSEVKASALTKINRKTLRRLEDPYDESMPHIETLFKIAKAFGINPGELFPNK
ncbi:MAG: helix-turn-helix transcriptional regulator [Oscillospiraceae bacterium]|nr:helix-turn-helix transcriptional regulator [Oscillospiraceae bacterium]